MKTLAPSLFASKKRDISKLKTKNLTSFPSKKLRKAILTECPLEADFCYFLEFDNAVCDYEAQPLGIKYRFGQAMCVYTPDFLVDAQDGEKYYEVKEKKYLENDEEFEARFEACQRASENLGRKLVLVTDEEIRRQPLFSNLKQLYHLPDINVPPGFVLEVKNTLGLLREVEIGKISSNYSKTEILAFSYKLLYESFLTADIQQTNLSARTIIRLTN